MNAISRLQRPLAIAMWDTGWLTRHYPHGSFADWDKTLDELVARGYDAIRIETFPHLVAAGSDGVVQERFFRPRGGGLEHMWRNPWSLYLEPRSALAEFLPKCRARGVKVGLATWFPNVSENRHKQVQGADEFVRVWHETLTFLDGSGLLDNVIYVDLLNEYPLWHGFEWLNLMLESLWHRGRTGGSPARTNDVCPSPDTAVRLPQQQSRGSAVSPTNRPTSLLAGRNARKVATLSTLLHRAVGKYAAFFGGRMLGRSGRLGK
jgi:hypothetical protein